MAFYSRDTIPAAAVTSDIIAMVKKLFPYMQEEEETLLDEETPKLEYSVSKNAKFVVVVVEEFSDCSSLPPVVADLDFPLRVGG